MQLCGGDRHGGGIGLPACQIGKRTTISRVDLYRNLFDIVVRVLTWLTVTLNRYRDHLFRGSKTASKMA